MDCKTAQSMVTPYIKRQLNDKELEEFVDHINECQECHEELEIYFTIHFALQKLDEDKNVSYNIQKMLEDDLETAQRRVHYRRLLRIYSYGMMFIAELLLAVVLLTQIELWNHGTMKDTFVYQFMYGEETESESETEAKPETEIEKNTSEEMSEAEKKETRGTEKPLERKTIKQDNGDVYEQKNSTD